MSKSLDGNLATIQKEVHKTHSLEMKTKTNKKGKTYKVRDGVTKKDVDTVVKSAFRNLGNTLIKGEHVTIKGFGTFRISKLKPRKIKGIDGKTYSIPETKVVNFKPANYVKKKLNGKKIGK